MHDALKMKKNSFTNLFEILENFDFKLGRYQVFDLKFLYTYLWSLGNSAVCMYLGMESFSLTNEIGDFNARVMACQFRFEP